MAEGTVLIVEDDATIARFVELELEHAGFGVLRAGDGPTAIDLLESNDVSLLILDLMLPGKDGIDRIHKVETPALELFPTTQKPALGTVMAGGVR